MGQSPRKLCLVLLAAAAVSLPAQPAAQCARQGDAAAWLYDPLRVNAIDLSATPPALDSLRSSPRSYVDAKLTLHEGARTFGPYAVGLKLKGQGSFRDLDGKAAFRIKVDYSVKSQELLGLKDLTLNNMVEDPSMLAEASSALMLEAVALPTPRVGYAYVRLNGADYGLYSDVETIDKVWAKRSFRSTQHIYEANWAVGQFDGAFTCGIGAGAGAAGGNAVEEEFCANNNVDDATARRTVATQRMEVFYA